MTQVNGLMTQKRPIRNQVPSRKSKKKKKKKKKKHRTTPAEKEEIGHIMLLMRNESKSVNGDNLVENS